MSATTLTTTTTTKAKRILYSRNWWRMTRLDIRDLYRRFRKTRNPRMAASRGASTPFLRIPRRLVSCRSLSSRAPSSASSNSSVNWRSERREREKEELWTCKSPLHGWQIYVSMRADQIIKPKMTPSWMTNYNLDERKSDYQLAINPS